MDELPYSEGLDYLHCVYFDNGVDVKRTNQEAANQSMLDAVMTLKDNESTHS